MWPSRKPGSRKFGRAGLIACTSGPGTQAHLHLPERAQVVLVRPLLDADLVILRREVGAAAAVDERGRLALPECGVLVPPRPPADVDHVAVAAAAVLVLDRMDHVGMPPDG